MKDIDTKGNWWVSAPKNGIIEVVGEDSRVICTLDVEDYDNIDQANTMAEIIASLPKLLTPSVLINLIGLMKGDKSGAE
mgnify:CR=1 FL=1